MSKFRGDWGPGADDFSEYMETYHPGTGAMVAMGCDDPTVAGPTGIRYDDGILMTDIGLDVGSNYYTQPGHMGRFGVDVGSKFFNEGDGSGMADIGYDMYNEYGAHPAQVTPYPGFGPSMAQTEYPHGPYDEPDMGFDRPARPIDTRGALVNGGLAAGGAAVGLHFGGPPGALAGAAIGGAIRTLLGR